MCVYISNCIYIPIPIVNTITLYTCNCIYSKNKRVFLWVCAYDYVFLLLCIYVRACAYLCVWVLVFLKVCICVCVYTRVWVYKSNCIYNRNKYNLYENVWLFVFLLLWVYVGECVLSTFIAVCVHVVWASVNEY